MGNETGRPLPSDHPAAASAPPPGGGGGAGLTGTSAGAVAGATLEEGGGEGEAIPYTSYSLPVGQHNAKAGPTGASTSPVAATSISPPSAAKPQRTAPNRDEDNIITIKPAAGSGLGTSTALLEPEEKELANLHKFLPILRSSVGGSSAWFSPNLKEIESMDVRPLVAIGREFQEFCRRNSLAVVHQQRALGSQLRSVEGLCSKTQQTCLQHVNEAKLCDLQLRDLTLLPDQISKANMLVRDIVLATQRLNALLPPTEQLASLHLSPLQATLGNGKATMGVTDSQPPLQNDLSPTCRVIVKSGMATDQGRRYTMEDAHVLLDDVPTAIPSHGSRPPKVRFYAVYDGHGGSQSALFSGKLLHKLLIEQPEFLAGDYEAAMRNAYRLMDQHILTQSDKHRWNDGTTAVTILMVDQTIVIGNAGDSESVLGTRRAGADGTPSSSLSAMLLTQNHKPNSPEERSRIEQAGGAVIFGRVMGSLAVSRALGDFSFKAPLNKADKDFVSAVPFVRKMELNEADEIVVIACDGLWDVVTYSEAIGLVKTARKEGKSPEEAAKFLVQTALIKGSQDNLTVIVLYLSWPSPPSTTTTAPTAPTPAPAPTPSVPPQPST